MLTASLLADISLPTLPAGVTWTQVGFVFALGAVTLVIAGRFPALIPFVSALFPKLGAVETAEAAVITTVKAQVVSPAPGGVVPAVQTELAALQAAFVELLKRKHKTTDPTAAVAKEMATQVAAPSV